MVALLIVGPIVVAAGLAIIDRADAFEWGVPVCGIGGVLFGLGIGLAVF